MACSTCMKVRKAINAPLARMGLPTLPITPPSAQAQATAPSVQPAVQQRQVNPAWPVRKPGA